jgi:hypothetical protein
VKSDAVISWRKIMVAVEAGVEVMRSDMRAVAKGVDMSMFQDMRRRVDGERVGREDGGGKGEGREVEDSQVEPSWW